MTFLRETHIQHFPTVFPSSSGFHPIILRLNLSAIFILSTTYLKYVNISQLWTTGVLNMVHPFYIFNIYNIFYCWCRVILNQSRASQNQKKNLTSRLLTSALTCGWDEICLPLGSRPPLLLSDLHRSQSASSVHAAVSRCQIHPPPGSAWCLRGYSLTDYQDRSCN